MVVDNQQVFPCYFAYDKTLNKVGCVLIQSLYTSTNITSMNLCNFNEDNWLLSPTPNLQIYVVNNQEDLERVIEMTKNANKNE